MANLIKTIALSLAVLAAALVLQSYAGQVQAGNFRTWISATGSNTNGSTGCQPSAPCQTIGEALSQTSPGGEVNCLGPAQEGTAGDGETAITINQAVTIDCHGTFEGKLSINGINAVVINAPGAVVTLRGVNFQGYFGFDGAASAGLNGVVIDAAAVVNIEDCVIENFAASGIVDQRGTGSGQLFIRNTVVRNNGTSGSGGLDIVPGSGATIEAVIDRSQISSNNFGIGADGRQGGIIRATVRDSVISGNTANGITGISSGASVVLLVDQSAVTANGTGFYVNGNTVAMLATNTRVFNNTTGLEAVSGGRLLTSGNNNVIGNTTEGAFTGTAGLQ